ncbi:uncharacterized protein [Diabrotica undecimpunctata]|uniref:uncharacterized protein n=1 Tax=Diabrotica undecimpunctata TaxID=50387 RepID=UPI003B63FF6C
MAFILYRPKRALNSLAFGIKPGPESPKNLRSLNRYPNKTTTLYITTYNCPLAIKWEVVEISEVRRKDEELLELASYSNNIFYYRRTPTGRKCGIKFLINKKRKRSVVKITCILDKVASLTFKLSKRYNIQIIQIYALTITHTNEKIEELYSSVSEVLNNHKTHFKYLIDG